MRDIVLDNVDVGTAQNINLVLEHHESVRIVGDRHSGIERIASVVAGRMVPITGTVLVLEKDIYRMEAPERSTYRNAHIGYVCPRSGFWPTLTVLENVAMPCAIRGICRTDRESMALTALKMTELDYGAYVYPQSLSPGEQRLAALARAIVNHPEIVILDDALYDLNQEPAQKFVQALWHCWEVWDFTLLSVSRAMDAMKTTKTFRLEPSK